MINDVVRLALAHGHLERVEDQLGAQVVGHRPADDAAREGVEHDREMHEAHGHRPRRACPREGGGDVGDPELVRRHGGEVALHQVGRRPHLAIPSRRRGPAAAVAGTHEPRFAHQPGYALATMPLAGRAQLGVDAQGPVGPAGCGVDRPDALHERGVLSRPHRGRPLQPGVGPRLRHGPARAPWRRWGRRRGSLAHEPKTRAAPRRSRGRDPGVWRLTRPCGYGPPHPLRGCRASCRSARTSPRRRASSSFSAALGTAAPPPGPPPPRSASRTQLRMACAEGSNSRGPARSGHDPHGRARPSAGGPAADTAASFWASLNTSLESIIGVHPVRANPNPDHARTAQSDPSPQDPEPSTRSGQTHSGHSAPASLMTPRNRRQASSDMAAGAGAAVPWPARSAGAWLIGSTPSPPPGRAAAWPPTRLRSRAVPPPGTRGLPSSGPRPPSAGTARSSLCGRPPRAWTPAPPGRPPTPLRRGPRAPGPPDPPRAPPTLSARVRGGRPLRTAAPGLLATMTRHAVAATRAQRACSSGCAQRRTGRPQSPSWSAKTSLLARPALGKLTSVLPHLDAEYNIWMRFTMSDRQGDKVEAIDLTVRLRYIMALFGLTVAELAEKAGVSKRAMENYLAAPSSPRATTIVQLCDELGISIEWLLCGYREVEPVQVRDTVSGGMFQLLRDVKADAQMAPAFAEGDPQSDAFRRFASDASFRYAGRVARALYGDDWRALGPRAPRAELSWGQGPAMPLFPDDPTDGSDK